MKKLLLVALSLTLMSTTAFSNDVVNSVLKSKDSKENSTKTEKKSRRKKVEMCGECSKPETQCECAGHGNDNKKHDH